MTKKELIREIQAQEAKAFLKLTKVQLYFDDNFQHINEKKIKMNQWLALSNLMLKLGIESDHTLEDYRYSAELIKIKNYESTSK